MGGQDCWDFSFFVWLVGLFFLFTFVSNAWNVEELLNVFAEASTRSLAPHACSMAVYEGKTPV